MSDPDPRFATSSRPVNRRTAGRRDPLVPPPSNPAMQGRLAAVRARTQLGRALLEQVRTGAAIQQAPLKTLTIVASIVMTAGAAALFFALLESSILLGALGCVGLLAGGLMAWRGQRNDNALQAQRAAPLFDNASLTSLDRVLEEVAPELPQDTAAQLVDFKQLIVRLARQGAVAADEHFTVEDRLYIVECVRRYLPDTLQGYLAVPREQRQARLLEGRSAADLLTAQLDLLRAELQARESRMARASAEQLLRQQRFLQSKARR